MTSSFKPNFLPWSIFFLDQQRTSCRGRLNLENTGVGKQIKSQIVKFCYYFHGLLAWCIVWVKKNFFLLHVLSLYCDLLQKYQFNVIITHDWFTFFQVVNENHAMCIPKNRRYDITTRLLRFWSLWVAFVSHASLSECQLDSGAMWCTHVSSTVMYRRRDIVAINCD